MSQVFKKTYAPEEIQNLLQWFKERFDRLPPSLSMGKRGNIPDLRRTVTLYLEFVAARHENPTYAGQVLHLFEIRDCLKAEGFE